MVNTSTDSLSELIRALHESSPAYTNDEQYAKAKLPMDVTLLGMVTDVSVVQLENA